MLLESFPAQLALRGEFIQPLLTPANSETVPQGFRSLRTRLSFLVGFGCCRLFHVASVAPAARGLTAPWATSVPRSAVPASAKPLAWAPGCCGQARPAAVVSSVVSGAGGPWGPSPRRLVRAELSLPSWGFPLADVPGRLCQDPPRTGHLPGLSTIGADRYRHRGFGLCPQLTCAM